jgi:hypothetical protein
VLRNGKIISDVAIYLHKSRGEEEDLVKHETELVELAELNDWKYTRYKEVSSAKNIEYRPIMEELIKDISNDLYDEFNHRLCFVATEWTRHTKRELSRSLIH